MSHDVIVETKALDKVFETRFALRNVSFVLRRGDVVSLLGPNGAGKSTLLGILSTLSRPTRGTASLFGQDHARAAATCRGRIGVCAHATFLYEDLTAEENLRFYARLYGAAPSAVGDAIERFGLGPRRADRVRTLSRGWIQRVALARALLHAPELVLFDEPTTGLDRSAVGLLRDVITELRARGAAVLFATHDFGVAAEVGTRTFILARGAVAHDGPGEGDPVRLAETYARATTAPRAALAAAAAAAGA